MGWKAEAHKIYEARVVDDALARLAKKIDVGALPLSKEELRTLAKRARQALHGSPKTKERFERYQTHLSATHGEEVVRTVSAALVEINNAIGYEEK